MARDRGLEVRWFGFDRDRFEFDLEDLDALIGERTRLICIGGASNLTGTINDVAGVCRRAQDAGAWTFVDAVQSAPMSSPMCRRSAATSSCVRHTSSSVHTRGCCGGGGSCCRAWSRKEGAPGA